MKKIFVSAGIVAIGTSRLFADAYAPDLTATDATKLWTLSGTLRGFYDDNYTTAHSDASGKRSSWGFELTPSLSIIVPLQQTELGLKYTYGLYYYQDRENTGSNPIDQTHEADLWIDHAFTERWEAKIADSFIDSQEPQLTASGTILPYRTEGNNIVNTGTITVHTDWSKLFSTDAGYQNTYVQYQNSGGTLEDAFEGKPSLEGYLGQIDELVWLNLNYQFQPDLTFFVGYQFGINNFTAGEPIAFVPTGGGNFYYSDSLNSMSHYLYVGANYTVTEDLSVSARVGVQLSDNYNLPSFDDQSAWSYQPYAQIAATYTYLPGSYVQVGFTQSENSSDTPNPDSSNGSIALYEESSVLYGSINHQITPDLLASLVGHYQYSTYQGGANDGENQSYYDAGFNLSYTIDPHLSVEIGYNFDYVTASAGLQSYSRNREYIGVTGSY